jgi:hypothetical protein
MAGGGEKETERDRERKKEREKERKKERKKEEKKKRDIICGTRQHMHIHTTHK